MWHTHHFTLYDDREGGPLVHVERLEGGSNFRDPEDVAAYAEAFKRLLEAAVCGQGSGGAPRAGLRRDPRRLVLFQLGPDPLGEARIA